MGRIEETTAEQAELFRQILERAIAGEETQTTLGTAMGISQQHVSRLLKGECRPTVNMARRLSLAGFIRLTPFLDGDMEGADPLNPPPAMLSSGDATRLRAALAVVQDVLSRLP